MEQRELVINESSFIPLENDYSARTALSGISRGIAALRRNGIARPYIRAALGYDALPVSPGKNLREVLYAMLPDPNLREQAVLILGLSTKAPLEFEIPNKKLNRFQLSEPDGVSGNGLLMTVVLNGIALSLPSSDHWASDHLEVEYTSLNEDGLQQNSCMVDNLSSARNADAITRRSSVLAAQNLTRTTFWQERKYAFPSIQFGNDVEGQVAALEHDAFHVLRNGLLELNQYSADWNASGEHYPTMPNVTDESASTKRKYPVSRRFQNANGEQTDYWHHAKAGNSLRIHLRILHQPQKTLEIGYVGRHLPT